MPLFAESDASFLPTGVPNASNMQQSTTGRNCGYQISLTKASMKKPPKKAPRIKAAQYPLFRNKGRQHTATSAKNEERPEQTALVAHIENLVMRI